MDSNKSQVELLSDLCISVNNQDLVIGPVTKQDCHLINVDGSTVMHRAFSVLLFDKDNSLLVTQRSEKKITFPGYLTNACCSHPTYNLEELEEKDALGIRRAARRRLREELGIDIATDKIEFLTRFIYSAVSDCKIWAESELDYLLIVKLEADVKLLPNSDEVKYFTYLNKENFKKHLMPHKEKISPWFQLIIDNFLFPYWDNINNLTKIKECDIIHDFTKK